MNAAASKLAFDNGGAFILETRREVEHYLSRSSTRIKGAVLLYLKAPIALAADGDLVDGADLLPPWRRRRASLPPGARLRRRC